MKSIVREMAMGLNRFPYPCPSWLTNSWKVTSKFWLMNLVNQNQSFESGPCQLEKIGYSALSCPQKMGRQPSQWACESRTMEQLSCWGYAGQLQACVFLSLSPSSEAKRCGCFSRAETYSGSPALARGCWRPQLLVLSIILALLTSTFH